MAEAAYPESMARLVRALRRLPGAGPRSAERMALAMLKPGEAWADEMAEAVRDARARVRACAECGFFAEPPAACPICGSAERRRETICVVETAADVLPIERSGAFRGLYHCLGGRISPLDGIGPEALSIGALVRRVERDRPGEVILALGTDVEGETTAAYLMERLRPLGVRVSRPATGLPLGGGIDLADAVTLGRALEERRELAD